MSNSEKAKRWQISLKMILLLFALFGFELWIVQQGIAGLVFAPLIVAAFLEAIGQPNAARWAGILTVIFWLCYPLIWAAFHASDL